MRSASVSIEFIAFDYGVNSGPVQEMKLLQRVVGVRVRLAKAIISSGIAGSSYHNGNATNYRFPIHSANASEDKSLMETLKKQRRGHRQTVCCLISLGMVSGAGSIS